MTGAITTCYSFKGGSGRSMSLANIAWTLASQGKSVLAIDWDLEAPGLHRYFHPFLADPSLQRTEGLIDGLWKYVKAVPKGAGKRPKQYGDFSNYVRRLDTPLNSGSISLLGAGLQDDEYTSKVGGFDWNLFYSGMNGHAFMDAFAAWARGSYDHILIDSRTGVSDTAGICTVQLPDTVVLFFVYNRQSIEGTAAAGRAVVDQRRQQRPVRMLVCPSRVEDRRQAEAARWYAALRFEDVLGAPAKFIADQLRTTEVPHFSWCGFEEKLAIFEERSDENGTLLQAMNALAARVGDSDVAGEQIPFDILTALWRKAAFQDPRLAELEALRSGSISQRISQIKLWLAETLEDTDLSRHWAAAIAREAGSLAMVGGPSEDGEILGEGAVAIARRLHKNSVDDGDVADILRIRAMQLRRDGRHLEAYELIDEAIATLRERAKPNGVGLKLYELRAEVTSLLAGPEAAIAPYRDLIGHIDSARPARDPRVRNARARAHRMLAETLLEARMPKEALEEAELAVHFAARLNSIDRTDQNELGLGMAAQARAALATKSPDAEAKVKALLKWLERASLPIRAKTEIEVRVITALAAFHIAEGRLHLARLALDQLGTELPSWALAEAAEMRAKIALTVWPGSKEGDTDGSRLIVFMREAMAEAGDDVAAREIVLRNLVTDAMRQADDRERVLLELLRSDNDTEMQRMFLRVLGDLVGQSSRANRST